MRYRQRDPVKRQAFLRTLRQIIQHRGGDDVVYMDESGFEPDYPCLYGWSLRGRVIHGERSGLRRPRENLLAARRRDNFLAPIIFAGTLTAHLFEGWLQRFLFRELRPQSTLILDNAPFHRKAAIHELAQEAGHTVLFLPPYSPDLNKVEHDFAALKKTLSYAPPGTTLDCVVAAK